MPARCRQRSTAMTDRQTPAPIPHHVAIVMDGNGRWATRRFLPRVCGPQEGRGCAACAACRHCGDRGVEVLTVFAFSSENWNRPAEEVSGLMELLAVALAREVPQLNARGRAHPLRRRPQRVVRQGARRPGAGRGGDRRQHAPACSTSASTTAAAGTSPRPPHGLAARGEAITEQSLDARHGAGARARSGSLDPHRRRAAHQQLPAVAGGLLRALSSATSCGPSSTRPRSTRPWPTTPRRERRFGKTSEQVDCRRRQEGGLNARPEHAQATHHHRRRPAGHPAAGAVLPSPVPFAVVTLVLIAAARAGSGAA